MADGNVHHTPSAPPRGPTPVTGTVSNNAAAISAASGVPVAPTINEPSANASVVDGPPVTAHTVDVQDEYIGNIIAFNFKYILALIFIIITLVIVAAFQSQNPMSYLIGAGIVAAILIVAGLLVAKGISLANVMTGVTVALFLYFVYNTWSAYKAAGQEGIGNTQVLLMAAVLGTIIVGKFVLAGSEGGSGGFVQLMSIFFTIVSGIILYLISSLNTKYCSTPTSVDVWDYVFHMSLFIIIYAVTAHHPLIGLSMAVASFAYFNFEAKSTDAKKGTGNTEKVNLGISMFLIFVAVVKIVFPKFSLSQIFHSKPIIFLTNYVSIYSIIMFLNINVLYAFGAGTGIYTITGISIALLLAVFMLFW